MDEQSIQCPICQNKITFDVRQLLMGEKFTCENCQGQIGLAVENKPIIEETLKKLEEVKLPVKKSKLT
ncbi:MAG: hypothetical protein JNJ52_02855 [Flavobacterium sp.]|nr:hypothetical protein [Flavobacterium sp.]